MGFSRQEHWSGLPFLLQCMKVESETEFAQSCLTLSNPMDCSLPGSSIHGIFQERVLKWGVIAFSISRPFCCLLSCFSRVRLCATPEIEAHQVPPSLGFSGKNTGVGCHFLLQFMKVKSESEVDQSCLTLRNPMDCSLPGSSVHGIQILQIRILEWIAIPFSGGSSKCRD